MTVAEEARALAGIPFKHRCRNPQIGLDCAGLAVEAYRRAGWDLVDFDVYGMQPPVSDIERMLSENGFGEVHDMMDGDILQILIDSVPRHLGLVDGDGFWHVEYGGTVRRESIRAYARRIYKVWRLF